jgi:hypothetical protein
VLKSSSDMFCVRRGLQQLTGNDVLAVGPSDRQLGALFRLWRKAAFRQPGGANLVIIACAKAATLKGC